MRSACFVGDGHSGRVSAGAGFDGLTVRCTLSTWGAARCLFDMTGDPALQALPGRPGGGF